MTGHTWHDIISVDRYGAAPAGEWREGGKKMTTEQKHTRGPWYIKRVGNEINAGSWEILSQLDDSFICQLYRVNKIPHKTVEANARLIAAAPELLEALNKALYALNQIPNTRLKDNAVHGFKNTYEICSFIEQAIAKATLDK